MSAVQTNVFERFIEYYEKTATPDEIVAFQVPEDVQERANELLERQSAGELTENERIELQQMAYFERLFSSLKARAFLELKSR